MNTTTTQKTTERPSSFKARQRKLTMSGPRPASRKLMRSIARHNMEMEGVTRINRKRGEKKVSFFAQNWRRYFEMKFAPRKVNKKG